MFSLQSTAQTAGKVEINTTTKTFPGSYSPKHCFAIWVEDANGKFVRTLKVQAIKRDGTLTSWVKSSNKNRVDAVSGASLTSQL